MAVGPEDPVRQVDPLKLQGRITDTPVFNPWGARHPGVAHFEPLFQFAHLPEYLMEVSAPFAQLAVSLLTMCNDGPELAAALRKLLEAKDCAVRQRVLDRAKGDA